MRGTDARHVPSKDATDQRRVTAYAQCIGGECSEAGVLTAYGPDVEACAQWMDAIGPMIHADGATCTPGEHGITATPWLFAKASQGQALRIINGLAMLSVTRDG